MDKIRYVLGFIICPETQEVLLIEKKKPEFQKGFLNGIGGRIEPGEDMYQAIIREVEEECTLKTEVYDWYEVCTMNCSENFTDGVNKAWEVIVFGCSLPFHRWNKWDSPTDEEVRVLALAGCNSSNPNILGNIPWLVGMTVDTLINRSFFAPTIEYSKLSLPVHFPRPV